METGSEDKIAVIDLIINVLKEHEATLDGLTSHLQELADSLQKSIKTEDERGGDDKSELFKSKIRDLENLIDRYQAILKSLMNHCVRINDMACMKLIASHSMEKR